jgi:diphthamide synthase (EF-2-diphthine--ammonia ligase)
VRGLGEIGGSTPIDVCGENGEFHTVVLNGPVFQKRLVVEMGDIVEEEGHVFQRISSCQLVAK